MNPTEQIVALSNDLDRLIERYRQEFDLTYAAAVGVLNMKSFLLCQEAADRMADLEDDDDAES